MRRPLFLAKGLKLTLTAVLGKNRNTAKYRAVEDDGLSYEMIFFGDFASLNELIETGRAVDVLYTLSVNSFNGKESVQLTITHFR